MRTSRQIRNRMLRDMGIFPASSYHYRLEIGDRVIVRIVRECPPADCILKGAVRAVEDHGHYSRVVLWVPAQRRDVAILLHQDGPEDWGVVECRIVRRARQPLAPSRWC